MEEIKKKKYLRWHQGNIEIPSHEIWQVETYLDSITQIIRTKTMTDPRIKNKAHKCLSIIRKWTQKIVFQYPAENKDLTCPKCGNDLKPKNRSYYTCPDCGYILT